MTTPFWVSKIPWAYLVSGLKLLKFCISFLAIVIGLRLFWGLSPPQTRQLQKQYRNSNMTQAGLIPWHRCLQQHYAYAAVVRLLFLMAGGQRSMPAVHSLLIFAAWLSCLALQRWALAAVADWQLWWLSRAKHSGYLVEEVDCCWSRVYMLLPPSERLYNMVDGSVTDIECRLRLAYLSLFVHGWWLSCRPVVAVVVGVLLNYYQNLFFLMTIPTSSHIPVMG